MIEILKMQAVGKDGNFAIIYFDFLFQNMNELVYRLGNVTYVVADGSTAIHKDNHNLYKYNNRKWFKVATVTPPEIPNPDYVDNNGRYNIPNNEVHGYRTLDINVAEATTDYNALTNKPTINGTELSGNLTGNDLGLQDNIIGQDGFIESQYIPPEVFERMKVVTNDTERFALTTDDVQDGDIVYVNDNKIMYYVIDDTKLSSEDGYKPFSANIASKAVGDEDGVNFKQYYLKKADAFTPTTAQTNAMDSGIDSTKVVQIAANKDSIDDQQNTTASGGNGYALINGKRLYLADSAPTGDIPDGSIGVGW